MRAISPRWMTTVLLAAAGYNLLWGAWVVLFPAASFDLLGLPRPTYLPIWQSVGMIVGVYGVGYFLAALAPYRHWPIVLVGLLGKILGPIGFVWAASTGQMPWRFGVHLLANDLPWWIPFVLILRGAYREFLREDAVPREAALAARDASGRTLAALSDAGPLLVVLLRHDGCIFCRETLTRLRAARGQIEASGTRIALVHMMPEPDATAFFARYRLDDLPRFSDPERTIYRGLGLGRGRLGQLLAPRVWARGARAFFSGQGFALGPPHGDGFQMPGTFLIHRSSVLRAVPAATPSDLPDFADLCSLPTPP